MIRVYLKDGRVPEFVAGDHVTVSRSRFGVEEPGQQINTLIVFTPAGDTGAGGRQLGAFSLDDVVGWQEE